MASRHLIISITETKKPHKIISMLPFTLNDADSLDIALGEIKNWLLRDEAMLITILRDCHSESTKQEKGKIE